MPHLKSLWPDPTPLPDRLNVFEAILGQPYLDEQPDYVSHIDEETGQSWTFREVKKRANDLATTLGGSPGEGGLGLRAEDGELVGVISDNSSDYIVLVLALLKIGIPAALISFYSTPFELKHAIKTTRPTRIFTNPQIIQKVLPVAAEFNIPPANVVTMNGTFEGHKSLNRLIADAGSIKHPIVEPNLVSKDALALLLFSSGTSGLPKAVGLSHGNLLYAIRQTSMVFENSGAAAQPSTPQTPSVYVSLALTPMYHTYGLHTYCVWGFLFPTQLVIFRKWDTAKALKAISRYRVNDLSLVPSMWHQLVNHPDFEKTDFSSVFSIYSGAAHLPKEIASKILERTPTNKSFPEAYGMTETTAGAIYQPTPGSLNGRLKHVPGATGVLLPGMEARIVRDDGSEADFDQVGELWLKGGNVVTGYLNNPTATEETFIDGWVRTGDHFKVDQEHYFYFVDRKKDTLKVSGVQVSPMEIEQALLAHPQGLVVDATVAGVLGGRTSDEKIPRAWVVLSENGKKLGGERVIGELVEWHQTNLSKYKWLRGGIEVVDEIPKSPTGKTLRRVLQDRYERSSSATKAKL